MLCAALALLSASVAVLCAELALAKASLAVDCAASALAATLPRSEVVAQPAKPKGKISAVTFKAVVNLLMVVSFIRLDNRREKHS
ncbi:exported protein of unknown function [Acidithiobacillus ferrivorans]|uniref:Secreted protein n=1 Tax=Acidithiobacillus ferrivorans TaxID=160808 RepID=A0ABY1MPF4_9PROT|nr:exported protein of unknown function [Acidithiobacillus ferrivorans]